MAAEWRQRRLGELTNNFDGIRIPVREANRRIGPYPYYGASGVVDHVDSYLFDGEYLLIAEDGENLRTRQTAVAFLARGKFWVNNHAHVVQGNSEADTRFLMYALAATDISGYLTGSTMPKLTQGNLNRIPLLAPPLSEQLAITNILGTLDDKIDLNRRMNETLEAMARALFKSWFVDFAPVRAKADGNRQLVAAAVTNFPSSFSEAAVESIPRGWKVGRLDDIAIVVMGLSPDGDSYNSDGIGTPLINGPAQFGEHFPLKSKWTTAPTRISQPDDLILCVRGSTTGRHVISDGEYCLGRGVCAIRARDGANTFIYETLDSGLRQLLSNTTGSVFPNLSAPSIKGLPVLIPDVAALRAFNSLVTPITQRVNANVQSSATLRAIRDALLPKLLSGDLRVHEAERLAVQAGV